MSSRQIAKKRLIRRNTKRIDIDDLPFTICGGCGRKLLWQRFAIDYDGFDACCEHCNLHYTAEPKILEITIETYQ